MNPIKKLQAALKEKSAAIRAENPIEVQKANAAISRIVAMLGLTAFVSNSKAASRVGEIFELIFAIAIIGVGYPIAMSFVFSANLTGWSSTMKTLWTVGMPSLLTLLVVFAVFEMYTHRPTA